MSVLLETRLPLAQGDSVDSQTYNRLVRVLELNLGRVDISISPHFNSTEISELQFATGAIIFNTSTQTHQAFDGTNLRNLYAHQTFPESQAITSAVGAVTVNT
tara:strand:+ start:1114 stop:1422 length:309 start_codon:yes stop_codon:yes gene_type:complete